MIFSNNIINNSVIIKDSQTHQKEYLRNTQEVGGANNSPLYKKIF